MNTLPIYKYLDLSTAHVTPKTCMYLELQVDHCDPTLIVYGKERGFFICVPDTISDFGIPQDLKDCLSLAIKNDCQWIVLDGDAEVVDCLKTYKWEE